MKKSISLFLIVASIAISLNLFAQEKWSSDPRKVGIVGIGKPSNQGFIMPNYINPNTTPRIINSPSGINTINPNIRVHPNNTNYQSEVYLTRSPVNPLIMFAGSNTYTVGQSSSFLYSTGYYITTNGGVNWYGNDTLNSNYGDPGPILDKNGVMIMTYLGNPSGMGSVRSVNNGLSWVNAQIFATGSVDKNLANTDESPSSPYYGRSYCVWSNFSASFPPIVVSYTSNSGVNWSAQTQINTPPSGVYSQGCDIVVNNAGLVLVTWAAPVAGSPYTEDYFGFAKSANGGVTWTVTENAFDGNGIRGTLANKNALRVNSFPRIDVDKTCGIYSGRIYIVTSQKNLSPAGTDADIVLHYSTNDGTSWSAGVRVNQDALNNGKTQWFPVVKVDEKGGVNVAYYDDRNVLTDSAEIYVSRSMDGGATWSDVLVSDARMEVFPISESGIATGYGGDYIGMACSNNKVWPFWMDRRTGLWQAFTTSIDLGPGINHTPLSNTEQSTGTIPVNCVITPTGSPIVTSLTKLFVAKSPAVIFDSVQMTNSSGNNWTANITLSGAGTYKYYIRTVDNLNRSAFVPAYAPCTYYSFASAPDVTPPVIVTTPLGNIAKSLWPATVTATVTDNLGVDSAWVRWYKNTPANTKTFKLINTTGSTYSAAFNSLNSDVVIGDNIYYRIIAQDISISHNRDSSALNNFTITNLKICEDFSGGVVPPTGWTVSGTYWLYSSASGYGTGTGSAEFNFYNASSGVTESLTSLTFDPTSAGDSIKFDHAYATYTTEVDQLAVESSTNGGSVWNTIITLNGGTVVGTGMVTAPPQTSVFTPNSSQWATKKYALPVGTNKVRFRAISAFGNNLYIDNICQLSPAPITLNFNLTALLSGNYNGSTMVPKNVTVELHGATTPYTLVESKTVLLNASGVGNPQYTTAVNGTPYYIVLKSDNGLETWSATPQTFSGSTLSYDFTDLATKAYGSNMVFVTNKWCIISGDANQDGSVDALDRSACWNDRNLSGVYVTDLNGDGVVDALDRSIAWNNRNLSVQKPALAANPNQEFKQDNKVNKNNSKGTKDLKLDGTNAKVKKNK